MPRKPALTAEDKARLVLEVIGGHRTLSDAARTAAVSTQAVTNWRKQFIEAGIQGFDPDRRNTDAQRHIRELSAQVKALKIALADAHLTLRAIRRRHVG